MLNYGDPRYTETFLQFQENNPTALENIIVMSTTDRSNALISMLKAKYNVYEISAPNEALFIQYLKDTFNEYKDYYEELLDTYDKKYDIDDLNKRIVESEITPDLVEEHIDLPRSSATNNIPTTIDKSKGSSSTESTTTDMSTLISLKNQYMRQVRNIYNEFAIRFMDCFLHIY